MTAHLVTLADPLDDYARDRLREAWRREHNGARHRPIVLGSVDGMIRWRAECPYCGRARARPPLPASCPGCGAPTDTEPEESQRRAPPGPTPTSMEAR